MRMDPNGAQGMKVKRGMFHASQMVEALPKITIVTPSLNQSQYIEKAIDSVLMQEYPELEYIVVDGGSTDGTLEILRRFSDRIQWLSEPDRGQSNALNKGFRIATGEVVGYLNSDDLYEPGALSHAGAFFASHPRAAWLTGRCRNINSEGKEIRRMIARYKDFWLPFRSRTILSVLNFISQPATFWRREVFEEIGYLDEALHYAMDYDYWLRIIGRYPLGYLPRTLACFRIHAASKTGATDHAQFDEELAIAKRYIRSPWIIALHTLHHHAAVAVYQKLLSRGPFLPAERCGVAKG